MLRAFGTCGAILAWALAISAEAQVVTDWNARYDGPSGWFDEARDLAVAADGSVYVTGSSQGTLTENCAPLAYCTDFTTIKYGPDGSELWAVRYDGPGSRNDGARALALDAAGNVYVTGDSYADGTRSDFATVKYGPNGGLFWVARYNGPAPVPYSVDEPADIVVDGDGNVIVTGDSRGDSSGIDFATVKYSPSGVELWSRRYDGPSSGDDRPRALVVDAAGNITVTGSSFHDTSGLDCLTIQYDPAGHPRWIARYNGPGIGDDEAWALALDGAGNVYVTGSSTSAGGDSDYVTLAYDSGGNLLRVARYDGPAHGPDVARAVTVDASGAVYVTGSSTDVQPDVATVKYAPDGRQLWARRYAGSRNQPDEALAIRVDPTGGVYIAGKTSESGHYDDVTALKYAADGTSLWEFHYDGPGFFESAHALALDPAGRVYVTGVSEGDFVTLRLTQEPTLWVSPMGLGDGSVSGPGIDCGTDCVGVYTPGTTSPSWPPPAPGRPSRDGGATRTAPTEASS